MRFTTKVAVWCALFASIALVVHSLVFAVIHDSGQTRRIHHKLRGDADLFFQELSRRGGNVAWISGPEIDALIPDTRSPRIYFEILGADRRVLLRSRSLESTSVSLADVPAGEGALEVGNAKMRTYSRSEGGLTIRMAEAFDAEEDGLESLKAMALSLPIVLLGIGLAAWFVARGILKPMHDMVYAIEGINVHRLSRRLPGADRSDELGRLSRAFNATLDRLEANFQQATRFSADASHELKTPIAVIRAGLGELMHSPSIGPRDMEAIADLMEQVGRVTAIMDGLLLLARADAGRLTMASKSVDVSRMSAEMVGDFELIGASESVTMDVKIEDNAWVHADPQMLRQLLANLLDNALKYNVAGGRVNVRVKAEGSFVSIRVGNTGEEIPEKHQTKIFQRFYRIEHTSEIPGTGLGLCIAREISRAMGGELLLVESRNGWTEFELRLPRSKQVPTKSGAA